MERQLAPDAFWRKRGETQRSYPRLDHKITTEFCVVGAGITGLTAAACLADAGRKVVVLEANAVASGTSGGTSGHLDATTDLGPPKLIERFGLETAGRVADGGRSAIDRIEILCREAKKDGVDCQFSRIPAYSYTERREGVDSLREELEATRKVGFDVSWLDAAPLPFPTAGSIRVADEGRFHPGRYLAWLARRLHKQGVGIYEDSAVEPPSGGSPVNVQTKTGGEVTADAVILATHAPFLGLSQLDTRVYAYMSYCLAAWTDSPLEDALFWDDDDPYHYVRRAEPEVDNLLIIGGGDHKVGQCEHELDQFDRLVEYTRARFGLKRIETQWSAEYFQVADSLPFVGEVPFARNVYLGVGFAGVGLVYGTLAGMMLADQLQGKKHPLSEALSPSRLNVGASLGSFVQENLNVAGRFVGDRFSAETVDDLDSLPPGEGRLVRLEGRLTAAYRDDAGVLHRLDPTCTHAGCVVHFNEAEKTWDCPCHGGRFTCTGERLYGPPPKGLSPASD